MEDYIIPNPEDPLWMGKLSMVRPGLVKSVEGTKLIGQSASPGRFVGPARVITSIEEARSLADASSREAVMTIGSRDFTASAAVGFG